MVSLEDYESFLTRANLLEKNDYIGCIEILFELIELIERDPEQFISRYPKRKHDLHNLKIRVKRVAINLVRNKGEKGEKESQAFITNLYSALIEKVARIRKRAFQFLKDGDKEKSHDEYSLIVKELEIFKDKLDSLPLAEHKMHE